PDRRAQLVPADLPRLSERHVAATVLERLQVEMGDPAELRHPGRHGHRAHRFALAALLQNRQPLTDEREPVLKLRVHVASHSLVTTRKYTPFYVQMTSRASHSAVRRRRSTGRPGKTGVRAKEESPSRW